MKAVELGRAGRTAARRHAASSAFAQLCSAALLCLQPPQALVPRALAATAPVAPMTCIASRCGRELAACVASASCSKGLACAGANGGNPAGQVRCMDLFENAEMRAFSECAMTRERCLAPLPSDEDERAAFGAALARADREPPTLPPARALLSGEWRIALGLNPIFDCFPCQRHTFRPDPSSGGVRATFRYRVARPDGSFLERKYDKLIDVPDAAGRPYVLRLRPTPPYLDYEDQWLLLGGQPTHPTDPWFLVRYAGRNAAWDGYGGANVYTRTGKPPTAPDAVKALDEALAKGGMRRSELTLNDNSCPPAGNVEYAK